MSEDDLLRLKKQMNKRGNLFVNDREKRTRKESMKG